MVRKRANSHVRPSYLCEVAGKFQTWFSAISPNDLKGIRELFTHDLTSFGKTSATSNSVVQPIRKQLSLMVAKLIYIFVRKRSQFEMTPSCGVKRDVVGSHK